MGYKGERFGAALIMIALVIFIIVVIIIPFSGNNLQSGDIPGHIQAAYYIRDHLWPSPIGWDQHFFGGYPLNQFYSPLVSWVTAMLGFVVPIEVAFKLIVILALLLTPLSVYYCARKFELRPLPAAVAALSFFALQFAHYDQWQGLEFYSIFVIGTIINAVAAPLLFFYIGRLRTDGARGSYLVPTLLLTAVSLVHILLGLSAWLFLACYLVLNWRQQYRTLFKHVALTVLLIAFWVIPFIAKIAYTDSESGAIIFISLTPIDVGLLIVVALSVAYLLILMKTPSVTQMVAFCGALMAIFLVSMEAKLPIQLFRIYLIALGCALFMPIKAISMKRPWLLVVPVVICAYVIYANYGIVGFDGPGEVRIPDFGQLDGRVFSTFYAPYAQSWHNVNSLVARTTDNLVSRGLFSESAPNSQFYLYMQWWLEDHGTEEKLGRKLDLFGVNWLVSDKAISVPYTTKSFVTRFEGSDAYLYRIGRTRLAVPLTYIPSTISGNWKNATRRWLDGDLNQIMVLSDAPLPQLVATGNEQVVVEEISRERIRVHVDSPTTIPVYLKFSDFPNWHAYIDGQPTPIYRVLPNFMLVYGTGDVELRYEQLPIDLISWLVSAAGLMWLIVACSRALRQRREA